MVKYDAHVGVEGSKNLSLEKELEKLGFLDDGLISRRVTWIKDKPVSSCPLIGIHMSKKYETKESINRDLKTAEELLKQYRAIGYGHSEAIVYDRSIVTDGPLDLKVAPVFNKLNPEPSLENKKWDIHVSIPKNRLDERLDDLLQEYGFDWIDLKKKHRNNQEFRVYSIQGISKVNNGKVLYLSVTQWLEDMKVPKADCKLESYIDMFRVGETSIVPPVVNEIEYL